MSECRIIVKIDENIKKMIDTKMLCMHDDLPSQVIDAIRHSLIIPNCGRLIDADKTMARLCKNDCKQTNGECKYFTRCSFWDAIQDAETIIPAMEEVEE